MLLSKKCNFSKTSGYCAPSQARPIRLGIVLHPEALDFVKEIEEVRNKTETHPEKTRGTPGEAPAIFPGVLALLIYLVIR